MSVAVDERISARRKEVREERRVGRLRRTLTVLALLVLLVVAALVERSDLVALSEIEVVGTERTTAAEIRRAADLELGTSTLRLGLREAVERVTALPYVASADASRVDPLTVRITVVERRPVLVATTGVTSVLLDDEGVVLARGTEPDLLRVVVPGGVPRPGETVADDAALANAHAVHVGLPGPIRAAIDHYEALGPDEVDLLLTNGVRVRIGRVDRLDEKARALGAILEDLGSTEITLIDVRAPTNPVVRR